MAELMDGAQMLIGDEQFKVLSHEFVSHFAGMRRTAMVALIDSKYLKIRGKFLTDRMPVLGRAEETMEDHQRCALAKALKMELHLEKISKAFLHSAAKLII